MKDYLNMWSELYSVLFPSEWFILSYILIAYVFVYVAILKIFKLSHSANAGDLVIIGICSIPFCFIVVFSFWFLPVIAVLCGFIIVIYLIAKVIV